MAEGTPDKPGETAAPEAPKNNADNGQPPVSQPKEDQLSEIEKLRKEKEQAEIRANQLTNQLEAKNKAEADKKAKELEEQSEFKTLYEQEKAKRESLESDREKEENRKALDKAKSDVLAGYSDEVKALAEEAGMDLSDTDEATVNTFKEKLDKIGKMVNATSKVGPNNPGRPNNNDQALSPDELKLALKDPSKFHDIVTKRPGIAMMTNQRPKV